MCLDFAQHEREGLCAPERKGESVLFAGYAALFGVADGAGDTIRPGAFAGTLAEGAAIPLYWQHNPRQRIGTVEALAEDRRGLRVIARLDSRQSRARLGDYATTTLADGLAATIADYRARRATLATGALA